MAAGGLQGARGYLQREQLLGLCAPLHHPLPVVIPLAAACKMLLSKLQNSLKITSPAFHYAPENRVGLSKEDNITIPRENRIVRSN